MKNRKIKICENCKKRKALTKSKKGYRFIKYHDLCNQCYLSLYSLEFMKKYIKIENLQD